MHSEVAFSWKNNWREYFFYYSVTDKQCRLFKAEYLAMWIFYHTHSGYLSYMFTQEHIQQIHSPFCLGYLYVDNKKERVLKFACYYKNLENENVISVFIGSLLCF